MKEEIAKITSARLSVEDPVYRTRRKRKKFLADDWVKVEQTAYEALKPLIEEGD